MIQRGVPQIDCFREFSQENASAYKEIHHLAPINKNFSYICQGSY
jgi:hypothetical protein